MTNGFVSAIRALFSVREKGGISSNVAYAFAAQGIALISSFLMTLVVPKVLGVLEYAYWQLFIFYAGYVAITLFGIGDGAYLRLGGKHYGELDKGSLKAELRIVFVMQSAIAAVLLAVVLSVDIDGNLRFVLLMLLIYGAVQNVYGFISPIFQAVNLTRIYSIATAMSKIAFFAILLVFFLLGENSYELLAVGYVMGLAVALLYCLICGRDIMRAKAGSWIEAVGVALGDLRVGLQVMIAYYASSLVVGVARQIIVMRWGLETFGQMSFAFAMVSFALAFIAQFSLVLFPVLRRLDSNSLKARYMQLRDGLFATFSLLYFCYFPGCAILELWLPEYADSFHYLGLLMPLLVFDGKMNILCSTYLKVYGDTRQLLGFNVLALFVSFLFSCVGAYIFGSVDFVICGLVLAITLRSVASELYLAKYRLDFSCIRLLICECIMALAFMLSVYFGGLWTELVSLICYVVSIAFNRGVIQSTKNLFFHRKKA